MLPWAVMDTDTPPSYDTDREALERDTEVSFFVAGGPGGQHRNKVSTGVRLRHRPSGIVVTATERRSQAANRAVAYERMAMRLLAAGRRAAPRIPTRPSGASKRQRLDLKRQRAAIKQGRRPVEEK